MNVIFFILVIGAAWGNEFFGVKNSTLREFSPGHYEMLEFRNEAPPEIFFEPEVKMRRCRFRQKKCIGTVFEPSPKSARENVVELIVEKNGKTHKFSIRILPESFPFNSPEGKSVLSRPLIFSAIRKRPHQDTYCHLVILSPKNELVFYRQLKELCTDFRPHLAQGKTWYSYSLTNEGIANVGSSGPRVLLDEKFNVIKVIDLPLDAHEFLFFGPDHWIGIEMGLERLKNGQLYLNKIIRERKNGEIVFEWSVKDYLAKMQSELTGSIVLTSFHGEKVAEILHLNSIQILNKEHLLVGFAYNGVALLERKSGKVIWHFGGIYDDFSIPMNIQPLFEHSATLTPEGKLCLFSNLTPSAKGLTSQVLCYLIDSEKRKVKSFEVLRDKGETSSMMGGVQFVGNVASIFFGLRKNADYDFIETSDGKDNWKLNLGKDWIVYRFYREPFGE